MKYICYWSWAEINYAHFDVMYVHCVSIYNNELSQHYASTKKVLQMWIVTNIQKYAHLLHILLHTCQENIYYF